MLWDEFCFATTQPLPDAELEKLHAEEAAARRRICEGRGRVARGAFHRPSRRSRPRAIETRCSTGICGPTLAPLLTGACARVAGQLDAAACGCEELLATTEEKLRAFAAPSLEAYVHPHFVIAATAPFAFLATGVAFAEECLPGAPGPPPAAEPAPEKPDGWVSLDSKFDVFVCTNV